MIFHCLLFIIEKVHWLFLVMTTDVCLLLSDSHTAHYARNDFAGKELKIHSKFVFRGGATESRQSSHFRLALEKIILCIALIYFL
jgi:hypothetical protein